jgi:hypothetical protein
MVDLFLAGAALLVLLVATVVLVRGERPGRVRLTVGVAVIVLAAGTFAVSLYSHQRDDETPSVTLTVPATSFKVGPGVGVSQADEPTITVDVPMGTEDKLPQGALSLTPPRPGSDPYTGEVSLLCSTPGKTEHEQNCTGGDRRVWTAEPMVKGVTLGPANGDPFTDPAACDGVKLQAGYLELGAGRSYCVRPNADITGLIALRVPVFPADVPLPKKLTLETRILVARR